MADEEKTTTKYSSADPDKTRRKTDEKRKPTKAEGLAGMASGVKMPAINKAGISEFFRKYWRVLKLARRPTKDEFFKISAVSAVGIVIIGVLGFLIYLIFHHLLP
jgi:protein transport protein SEC61 subunit gamma-like protein